MLILIFLIFIIFSLNPFFLQIIYLLQLFSKLFKQANLRIIPISKDNCALLDTIFKNQVSIMYFEKQGSHCVTGNGMGKVKNPVVLVLNCHLIQFLALSTDKDSETISIPGPQNLFFKVYSPLKRISATWRNCRYPIWKQVKYKNEPRTSCAKK